MWIQPTTLRHTTARLEPLEPRHAPDLFAAATPDLFRYTPQFPPEWSVAGFERDIATVTALPNVVAFAIVLNDSNQAIGRTTYMEIREQARNAEIGRTWISRAHQGSRVNPEIKYLMLRHAFETLSPAAIRIDLRTGGNNLHSQAGIAKLGAVREATLRKHRIVPDGPSADAPPIIHDTVIFSILNDEWPAVKRRLEQRLGGR